jgi:hypothetical protein
MGTMKLAQRSGGEVFAWQRLDGIYNGSDIETGRMSECVSLIYIDKPGGKDVRGYHAGGTILWANWNEIKKLVDMPFTKMITVVGYTRDLDGVVTDALKIIKKYGFQNIQWEFYKASNALVSRAGVVTDVDKKQPSPRLRVFISKLAPGLDNVVVDDRDFDVSMTPDPKSRPLPPVPGPPKSRKPPPPPLPRRPGQ